MINTHKTLVAVAFVALVTGCASTKPLEADVATLKTQVSTLQGEVDTLKRNDATTAQAATEAQRNAQAAASKADQALAAAQASDQKIAETNEHMDRMFRRSVSK